MKLVYLGLASVFGVFILVEVGSLFLNRGLRLEIETAKTTTLEDLRSLTRADLERYRLLEGNEYAEIPLERAFDYYLRHARR